MTRGAMFKQAGRAAAVLALGFVTSLPAGCAIFGGDDNAPAWFSERVEQLEDAPYPQLAAVPNQTPSSRTDSSWADVRTQVETAGAALQASPRAAPPAGNDVAAGEFEAAARRDVEAAARPER